MGVKKLKHYVKFYDNTKRKLCVFEVVNLEGAKNALIRMNVKAGWHQSPSGLTTKIVNPYYFKPNNIFSRYGLK